MRLLAVLPFLCLSALAAAPDVYVAYPPDKYSVTFDHVLLEGSVPAGASLSVNGQPAPVGPDGLFILWQPLRAGVNTLTLSSTLNGQTGTRALTVTSAPPTALPARPTSIAAGSVTPASSKRLYALPPTLEARTITVTFRGSPGGQASFRLGSLGPFSMVERTAADDPGSDPASLGGVYEGSYVLQPADRLEAAPITVSLKGADGATVTATAKGTVSAADGAPRVGIETADIAGRGLNAGTYVWRNGAGRNYIVFPRTGVKTVVIGEEGNTYLARLGGVQTVNIPKDQLRLLPVGTPLPDAIFTQVTTRVTPTHAEVRVELPERLPFTIEQTAAAGDQHLDLRLYHARSDVDYIVSASPDPVVRDVHWVQEQDGVVRLRVDLKGKQQWGYDATYEGNTLVLRVKRPPVIAASRPLAGHTILIDPGHGGTEGGAAGALRVNEKDITLAIAQKLAARLRALGATVNLTREKDVTLDLYSRDLLAETQGAELLVSVHTNALPDGADPSKSRGTGAYYYLPQARPLVDSILASVARTLPDVGIDGAHYQNLALTRPSTQLSVLVETAFMTDPQNLRTLMSESGKDRFAQAIALGIENFYRQSR